MVLRDIQSAAKATLMFAPQLVQSSTITRDVDMRGYRFAQIVALIGARGDTWDSSNHIQLEVEESVDNRAWTDVADANLQSVVTGDNTGTFAKLSAAGHGTCIKRTTYRGGASFIRVRLNLTGTHSTGTIIGILVERFGGITAPIPADGSSASASTSPSSSRSPSSSASASRSPSASLSPSASQSPSSSRSPSRSASSSPSS